MKKLFISLTIMMTVCLHLSPLVISANNSTEQTISLSLEEAKALALKDNANVKLLESRMKAFQAQLAHLGDQMSDLSTFQRMPGGSLPTSYDYFLKQYPDFEDLTEEEQYEIHQIIVTQIMINTSLNQYIDSQAGQYNRTMEEQLKQQREQLTSSIISTGSEKEITLIEKEKTQELISFYVAQKYIGILSLENDLSQLEAEKEVLGKSLEDSQTLLKYGLITSKEIDQIEYNMKQKEKEIKNLNKTYQFYIKEFSIELNLPLSQDVHLEPLNVEVKQMSIVNLQDQLAKNFDIRVLDEQIKLARTNYNITPNDQKDLRLYYSHILEGKILERDILLGDLKEKLRNYEKEQEDFFDQLSSLQEELERNKSEAEDAQIKFKAGLISQTELENYLIASEKIEASIRKAHFEFLLFREKVNQVSRGIVM